MRCNRCGNEMIKLDKNDGLSCFHLYACEPCNVVEQTKESFTGAILRRTPWGRHSDYQEQAVKRAARRGDDVTEPMR